MTWRTWSHAGMEISWPLPVNGDCSAEGYGRRTTLQRNARSSSVHTKWYNKFNAPLSSPLPLPSRHLLHPEKKKVSNTTDSVNKFEFDGTLEVTEKGGRNVRSREKHKKKEKLTKRKNWLWRETSGKIRREWQNSQTKGCVKRWTNRRINNLNVQTDRPTNKFVVGERRIDILKIEYVRLKKNKGENRKTGEKKFEMLECLGWPHTHIPHSHPNISL